MRSIYEKTNFNSRMLETTICYRSFYPYIGAISSGSSPQHIFQVTLKLKHFWSFDPIWFKAVNHDLMILFQAFQIV